MTPTLIQVLAMGACSNLAVVSREGTSSNTIDKTLLPSATEILLYFTAINELPVNFLTHYISRRTYPFSIQNLSPPKYGGCQFKVGSKSPH